MSPVIVVQVKNLKNAVARYNIEIKSKHIAIIEIAKIKIFFFDLNIC